jgi:hypothetical protein
MSALCERWGSILPSKNLGQRLARFRQFNVDYATSHHDALEFPDGQVVLLTRLCEGQRATVLQLPAVARPAAAKEPVKREVREPGRWLDLRRQAQRRYFHPLGAYPRAQLAYVVPFACCCPFKESQSRATASSGVSPS